MLIVTNPIPTGSGNIAYKAAELLKKDMELKELK